MTMNNVEAGRESTEEKSQEQYRLHASFKLSQRHDATKSTNLIHCYHRKEKGNVMIKNQQKHHELGGFRHMMDEAWSRFIIREAVPVKEEEKKTSLREFIRFGSALLSELGPDNEQEQKTELGMCFSVFLAGLLCMSAHTFVLLQREINLVTELRDNSRQEFLSHLQQKKKAFHSSRPLNSFGWCRVWKSISQVGQTDLTSTLNDTSRGRGKIRPDPHHEIRSFRVKTSDSELHLWNENKLKKSH